MICPRSTCLNVLEFSVAVVVGTSAMPLTFLQSTVLRCKKQLLMPLTILLSPPVQSEFATKSVL